MRPFTLLLLSTLFMFTACVKEDVSPGIGEVGIADGLGEGALAEIYEAETNVTAEIATILAETEGKSSVITIPAGSVDAIATALAKVDRNGIIRLASGDHTQNGTLLIDKTVTILGAPGARLLISGVAPFPTVADRIVPGIHVIKAERVRIRNVELVPVGGQGGTAILVQNAPYTFISRVVAKDWQNGVIAEQSQRLYVERSEFVGSSQWQGDPNFPVFGVVVVNGPVATIHNNTFQNQVFAVWACDKRGRLSYNKFAGNYNGIELCKVPVSFPLPNGDVVGSEFPATSWLVYHNQTNNNFNNGFEVIDGANNCLLVNNVSHDNGGLDYEFAGPTERYGFPAPTSSRNRAYLQADSRWKDCGEGNRVRRGVEVSTADSPCF